MLLVISSLLHLRVFTVTELEIQFILSESLVRFVSSLTAIHHTPTIHTTMLGLFLLQAIIIADISSLRNRLFWSIFPSIPGTSSSSVDSLHRSDLNAYLYRTLGTINVWLAGTVASKFLLANNSAPNNWRWGYGMSASELRHWIDSCFS